MNGRGEGSGGVRRGEADGAGSAECLQKRKQPNKTHKTNESTQRKTIVCKCLHAAGHEIGFYEKCLSFGIFVLAFVFFVFVLCYFVVGVWLSGFLYVPKQGASRRFGVHSATTPLNNFVENVTLEEAAVLC